MTTSPRTPAVAPHVQDLIEAMARSIVHEYLTPKSAPPQENPRACSERVALQARAKAA